MKKFLASAALAFVALAASAQAAVITVPTGTLYNFPVLNAFGSGPQAFGPGITWTSTNASTQGGSVFGYNGGYGFSGNGSSNANLVGLNDSFDVYGITDSMTFAFANPVSSVGGVLNWVPSNAPVTIEAFDSGMVSLGSLTLSSGGANLQAPNSFYGFQDASADISYFRLTDGYVAVLEGLSITGLTTTAVPEPLTLSVFGAGVAGAIAMRRRKKKSA